MATVTTQASAVYRPQITSKSRFLTGSSGKLTREVAFRPVTSSASSFKVEAKKGEWLPGLPSPGYLTGRYLLNQAQTKRASTICVYNL